MDKVVYFFSAILATLINVGLQYLTFRYWPSTGALWASIIVGTGGGLIFKYFVDKIFAFKFQSKNLTHDSKLFLLYAAMGLITTAIFLAFELSFHFFFPCSDIMRYAGACAGLSVGYFVKYHLDRRYIFVP